MAEDEMFHSAVRSTGDQAGVFEFDGNTGYFYLYRTEKERGQKVVAAIRVLAEPPDFAEEDVAIRWDATETNVGLFIQGELWAVFDSRTGAKYGGDYRASAQPGIPLEIAIAFGSE